VVVGPGKGRRQKQMENVLLFELDGLRYALPSADVSELLRAVTVVPLPKAPRVVEGVINVRGQVVPVLDVRTRFQLPPKTASPTDHLILARAGERLVAIRADRALELVRLDAGDFEEAKSVLPGAACVMGVAKLADGLVLIHDLRTFLEAAEAAAFDEAVGMLEGHGGRT
jgi:purine-binding chemotaxis protein CheW